MVFIFFFNAYCCILNPISLKFVPRDLIDNVMSGHWFTYWPGAIQAPGHYQNQWWPCSLMHISYASLGLDELTKGQTAFDLCFQGTQLGDTAAIYHLGEEKGNSSLSAQWYLRSTQGLPSLTMTSIKWSQIKIIIPTSNQHQVDINGLAQDIKNNAWVTVNNDFSVTSEVIRQWFSRVMKSRVKIFAESLHEWQKWLFTVRNVLFYFSHAILCHEHTDPLRNIIERSFHHCCQGQSFLT